MAFSKPIEIICLEGDMYAELNHNIALARQGGKRAFLVPGTAANKENFWSVIVCTQSLALRLDQADPAQIKDLSDFGTTLLAESGALPRYIAPEVSRRQPDV